MSNPSQCVTQIKARIAELSEGELRMVLASVVTTAEEWRAWSVGHVASDPSLPAWHDGYRWALERVAGGVESWLSVLADERASVTA